VIDVTARRSVLVIHPDESLGSKVLGDADESGP
jgi:hypothetical protein